ncbi:MAG TPA: ATP-binding cassette domain-containing protein [Steroidobacteraceae bacterium]|nr:ATP-binding cassette domain-containing protein [Steroidobacteraceae bacterium]
MINTNGTVPAVLSARDIHKRFTPKRLPAVQALAGVSLEAPRGMLTALVGPDGAGKTTLIRLAAGLLHADSGELLVLGIDSAKDPQQIQDRISYMPQRFGLYEDLTVAENIDLYADLHGVTPEARAERYPRLMEMTNLGRFRDRLAGKLSGGMKQKLGLACTLVRSPELLLLDEPTVGVDPLSRRELWEIVRDLVDTQGLTVLLSTAYLDEAERCGHVIVLHQGKVLAQGQPGDITDIARGRVFVAELAAGQSARGVQSRLLDEPGVIDAVPDGGRVRFVRGGAAGAAVPDAAGTPAAGGRGVAGLAAAAIPDATVPAVADRATTPVPAVAVLDGARISAVPPRFEDGFMSLLRRVADQEHASAISLDRPLHASEAEVAVHVHNLARKFGTFTAVDHISFDVHRGAIFGLLGPNGAGKTTTFRMLCGLLPATDGELRVAGADVLTARASARAHLGYVAQKFSLYGTLTVAENLDFFASAYGLRGPRKSARIAWAIEQFELGPHAKDPSAQLPGGFKQRLAMAAALLHEPQILFLDEPTSGADPLARRAFWRRITALAEQGVTIIVTTHFMQEAEYCDRIAIMDAGKVLAEGPPGEIRHLADKEKGEEPSMEDAFIAVVERSRKQNGASEAAA